MQSKEGRVCEGEKKSTKWKYIDPSGNVYAVFACSRKERLRRGNGTMYYSIGVYSIIIATALNFQRDFL